jgi:hypothetical protein
VFKSYVSVGRETSVLVTKSELSVRSVLKISSFRHTNVARNECAVSQDGIKLFSVTELEAIGGGFASYLALKMQTDKCVNLGRVSGVRLSDQGSLN